MITPYIFDKYAAYDEEIEAGVEDYFHPSENKEKTYEDISSDIEIIKSKFYDLEFYDLLRDALKNILNSLRVNRIIPQRCPAHRHSWELQDYVGTHMVKIFYQLKKWFKYSFDKLLSDYRQYVIATFKDINVDLLFNTEDKISIVPNQKNILNITNLNKMSNILDKLKQYFIYKIKNFLDDAENKINELKELKKIAEKEAGITPNLREDIVPPIYGSEINKYIYVLTDFEFEKFKYISNFQYDIFEIKRYLNNTKEYESFNEKVLELKNQIEHEIGINLSESYDNSPRFNLIKLKRYNIILNIINILKSKNVNVKDEKIAKYLAILPSKPNNIFVDNNDVLNVLLKKINKYKSPKDVSNVLLSVPEDTDHKYIEKILDNDTQEHALIEASDLLSKITKEYSYDPKIIKEICKNMDLFLAHKIRSLFYKSYMCFKFLFKTLKGKDSNFIKRIIEVINFNDLSKDISYSTYSIEKHLHDIFKEGGFTTPENFIKIINDVSKCHELMHAVGANDQEESSFIKKVINNKINVHHDAIEKVVNTVFDKNYQKIALELAKPNNRYLKFCKKMNLDVPKLVQNFNSVKELFDNGKIVGRQSFDNDQYTDLLTMNSHLEMIANSDAIEEYIDKAQPKDSNLFKLNYKINNQIYFKVLEDLSPLHFSIGAATNCCQRIGGVGEAAAIDSFINPLAGILILYFNGDVVSQSYFHYIPQDNGIILDNIEDNENNSKKLAKSGISINDCYAALARQAKIDLNLKYFRCGLEYTDIDIDQFGFGKLLDDSRHFAHDEIYSDYKNDKHLDLLKPKFKTNLTITKMAMANYRRIVSVIKTFNKIKFG